MSQYSQRNNYNDDKDHKKYEKEEKKWKDDDKKCKEHKKKIYNVVIPGEDRFYPFALTIHEGDKVRWTNNNSDPHTVVSDDAVNKIGPKKVDLLIEPGESIELRFKEIGQWVYYCRFHAHLDEYGQPVAPGCGEDGKNFAGIQEDFRCGDKVLIGNFGTPMFGVITILPREKKEEKKEKRSNY